MFLPCFTNLAFNLAQSGGATPPNPWTMPGMIAIMIGLMYFIMIRPQQRRDKERRAMLSNLKKGNKVMFSGGIVGQIHSVKEDEKMYVIKIADNVKIDVHQEAVTALVEKDQTPDEVAAT